MYKYAFLFALVSVACGGDGDGGDLWTIDDAGNVVRRGAVSRDGSLPVVDGGVDSMPIVVMPDAEPLPPPCKPAPEVFNGADDDCNGMVDDVRVLFDQKVGPKGHTYLFATTPMTGGDALAWCRAYGYELVQIDDEFENTFVGGTARGTPWIGLVRSMMDAQFYWSSGAPLTGYTNWNGGEPSVAIYGDEDCVHMNWTQSGKAVPNGWNDFGCHRPNTFVCEGQL